MPKEEELQGRLLTSEEAAKYLGSPVGGSSKRAWKTEKCQVEHVGYVVSGGLHVEREDGSTGEVTAGDVDRIAAGHDAWVLSDLPAVLVEFQGAAHYAEG